MKKITNIILIAILAFASCKKQLEVDLKSAITPETAFSSKDGISAAITGVYANLKGLSLYGKEMIVWPEVLADNGLGTNHSGRLVNEARNTRNVHFSNWATSYFAINQINLILKSVATNTITPTPTVAEKANWEGQLYFLRGLYYFDLVKAYSYIPSADLPSQNFGGVPLMLQPFTDYETALAVTTGRGTTAAVYTQIIKDLNDAITRLTTSGSFPFVATKSSAQALLARVSLYNNDFAIAKAMADAVILSDGARLTNASNHVASWTTSTNPESLFEVKFNTAAESIGVNESLQSSFTSIASLTTNSVGWGDMGASPSLLADLGITLTTPGSYGATSAGSAIATRTADVRNLLWDRGNPARGLQFVECKKYLSKNGAPFLDNAPVIRIPEMYLIRAEVLSNPISPLLNVTAAQTDLNTILINRGLTAITLTGTALFDEVIKQRRIEFAAEGHRFFDLKRLGQNFNKSPFYLNLLFNDYRMLPPIPNREIQLNPNIVQNFNY